MDEKLEQVFRFGDLSAYSFRQRMLIRIADLCLSVLVVFIGSTMRVEVDGLENLSAASESGLPPIFAAWHEHLIPVGYFLRGRRAVAMISRSFDGEYASRLVIRFGSGVVRGSTNKRGAAALIEMARVIEHGFPAAITVDGPKGPPHVVKGGVSLLAKRTGATILPIAFEAKRCFRINSWDKLRVPVPFTRGRFVYGTPISVAKTDDIDEKSMELQAVLDGLERSGAEWLERL